MTAHPRGQREWEILRLYARTSLSPAGVERLRSLLRGEIDWGLLYSLARRHGVVALLYRTFSVYGAATPPAHWLEKVRSEALAHGKRNLLTAQELVRLLALLERNGIPALALKGPSLAVTAYGDLAVRQYGDLDILVRPQDVGLATAVLLADRYFTDSTVLESERPFGRRDGWVVVDLHWGVTVPHFAGLLDEEGMWERAQMIPLAGGQVRTLALEDHLLALAVHGCKDGWSRLKWVCDVAELVGRHALLDWETLEAEAKRRGATRVLWVALALARRLLGMKLPDPIQRQMAGDAAVARLADRVAAGMQREEKPGVLAQALEEFNIQFSTLSGMRRRTAYALYRLRLLATPTAEDRSHLPLPGRLAALHYLTRPLRLAWSYGLPWLRV